ncbi:MAG: hypothetical protein FWG31_03795 [Oscillospiraceae bacterium]|nr:hypothetical protein [Oscillospiraceae bacterium]
MKRLFAVSLACLLALLSAACDSSDPNESPNGWWKRETPDLSTPSSEPSKLPEPSPVITPSEAPPSETPPSEIPPLPPYTHPDDLAFFALGKGELSGSVAEMAKNNAIIELADGTFVIDRKLRINESGETLNTYTDHVLAANGYNLLGANVSDTVISLYSLDYESGSRDLLFSFNLIDTVYSKSFSFKHAVIYEDTLFLSFEESNYIDNLTIKWNALYAVSLADRTVTRLNQTDDFRNNRNEVDWIQRSLKSPVIYNGRIYAVLEDDQYKDSILCSMDLDGKNRRTEAENIHDGACSRVNIIQIEENHNGTMFYLSGYKNPANNNYVTNRFSLPSGESSQIAAYSESNVQLKNSYGIVYDNVGGGVPSIDGDYMYYVAPWTGKHGAHSVYRINTSDIYAGAELIKEFGDAHGGYARNVFAANGHVYIDAIASTDSGLMKTRLFSFNGGDFILVSSEKM